VGVVVCAFCGKSGSAGLLLLGVSIVVCNADFWMVGLMDRLMVGWLIGSFVCQAVQSTLRSFYVGGAPVRKGRPGSDAVSSVQVNLACDRADDK
jgi:hypothetical protein